MAEDKRRTAEQVYQALGRISKEEGIDFGLGDYTQEQFKQKYFTGPGNIENLYNTLNTISDEENIDFGQGSRDEWLASFGYKRTSEDTREYSTLDGRRIGGSQQQVGNQQAETTGQQQETELPVTAAQNNKPGILVNDDAVKEISQSNQPSKKGFASDLEGRVYATETGSNGKLYASKINQTPEEQAMQQRMSQVGEIFMEPEGYSFEPDESDGKMHYSWRNGRRVGKLDPGALRFAHIGRDYSSDAYTKAEDEAAEMSDEQLASAFNQLYNSYAGSTDAALMQGYGRDDASRMMAYATEMRYRDIGMPGHARDYGKGGQQKSTGVYHYYAAKMDPLVSSEMKQQDDMSWDERVSYLSDVLRDKQAREKVINLGRGSDDDRKALEEDKRKLLAGSMLYARDNNRYPEDAYSIVIGAANNATPKDTGFFAGFASTTSQMFRDVKYAAGEFSNLFSDDRGDVLDAIRALDKYGDEAVTKLASGILHNLGALGYFLFDGDEAGASEGAYRMLQGSLVIGKDGRVDVDATRAALMHKLQTTYSWGDLIMRDNVYNTAMAKQTEGNAAWWGQQMAQLVPTSAALVVGVTTRNPAVAQAIGQLGMGYMCISSGSQAMQEARQYGATDSQVWTAGIVNAILEYATERIPFDRYTRRVFGEVKAASARKLMDAVVDPKNPAHHEIQQLLETAKKELGSGKAVKAYTGDVLAEGSSEFAAGTLQKAAEILYKNPEDYPTFSEILEEGVESFKGGAAMGGVMGGVSVGTTYLEADNRRKKAGKVTVGIYESADGLGVPIEIVSQDSNGNYIAIDGQHQQVIVKPDEVKVVVTYSYDEWKKGEAQYVKDQGYNEGYAIDVSSEDSGDSMVSVRDRAEAARQALYQLGMTDDEIDALDNIDTFEGLDNVTGDAVKEYINARSAMQGMLQKVRDDISDEVEKSSDEVDQRTNKSTGMVQRATLKTGGDVFIIDGEVNYVDGGIDIDSSTQDLVVFNPVTGKNEMIHVSDIAETDEPIDALQLKQETTATIQQTKAQAAADRINGTLPFNPGDVYTLPIGEEQLPHEIQIIGDAGDGSNVIVSVDGGEQMYMPKDMLQEASDAVKQAQIDAEVQAKAATQQQSIEQTEETDTKEKVDETEPEEVDEDAMPMVEVKGKMKPDFSKATPERAHRYIFEERGLSAENAKAFVENSRKAAEDDLKKLAKKEPKMGTDLDEFDEKHGAWEKQVEEAKTSRDYWQSVADVQANIDMEIVRVQAEERARIDAEARAKASEEMKQQQAEKAAKRAEAEERGPFKAGIAVIDKWENAPKVEGVRDQIILADGTAIAGHYVLGEAGAATPSHDPSTGWKASEGFPVDENGGTVNDRDYERDKAAQEITIRMSETYDSRAAQSVPIVTSDGVVLSGNGRTIAGDLAAQAGTDGAYIEYLKEFGGKYGFNAEQVGALQHPRVLFVPDEKMPYTAETFAKFNAQEMKGQNLTETAVKLGKTVDDVTFNDVIGLINQFDTMSQFYGDESAPTQAITMLLRGGVINPMQHAQMFDGDKVSTQGEEMLENLLLGKAFEGNPDAIRQLMSMPSVRQQVVSALAEIANNAALGDYSLENELSQAIALVEAARRGNIKQGDTVSNYARQMSLFPEDTGATVADYRNAMVLILGDILNGRGKNTLKNLLTLYNQHAADAAAGVGDLFTGGVKTPEDILKEAVEFIKNSSKNELKQELKQAVEQRKEGAAQPAGEQRGSPAAGEQTGSAVEGSEGRVIDEAVATAEQETDTEPTDGQKEAGNYKKGHVKIDGFDVTIEQPKGSVRSGVDASGKAWSQEMHNTYGYIRGTEGVDGDHIDMFLSDHLDDWNGMVYVVDQVKDNGSFDEHKVMYGFNSEEEARNAYLSNYSPGWKGLGTITGVTRDEFRKWIESSHRKTKPFAEYKSVKPVEGAANEVSARETEPIEDTAGITPTGRKNQYGVYLEVGNIVSFYDDGIIHHGDIIDFDGEENFTIREWISKREGKYRDIVRSSWQIPRLYGKQPNKAADVEAGGAVVDQLKDMGVDVNTDINEYRKTLSDAKKDNSDAGKIKYLKTSDGTTYGFTYRGKINLDPRKIDAELPLHEYGHLWGEAIRLINPEKWQQVVDVLKSDADTWEFLKSRRPDLKTDDEIADEMIAEFSGKNGEEKLKAELERLSQTNSDYKTKWGNIYKNIVKAIQDFWKAVGDFLQIDYKTPQQVYDQVLKDFASGMNPRARVEKFLKERDAEFVDAVERGDMEGATRLFNEALSAEVGNGMTPFISVGSHKKGLAELARKVKRGNQEAIDEVAKLMAPIIPKDAVLVPAPSHTGRATYMLDIANAISKITGADVADVLRGPERETQYGRKKATGKDMTADELGVTVDGEVPAGKVPVVLDNVVATGNTAEACVQALGKGIVCSLTKATDQYNHAATLKSANVVVRDSKGNVIPLSKRFDLSQGKRLGNIQFSKAEGKAEPVSEREAALRDALIDELREAGIKVITDNAEAQRELQNANSAIRLMAEKDNIDSGINALRLIVEGAEAVPNAMRRNDLSQYGGDNNIMFIYGEVGDPDRNFKKGYGIAHIGGKHGAETLLHVLQVIASGKIDRYVPGNKTVVLSDGEYEVVLGLTRFGNKETWLFNGWKKDEKTGADGEVGTHSDATQANPTFSREDLGAVLSDAKIQSIFGTTNGNIEKIDFHRVWHGSAADFDTFDHSHMGEGEGAQAYGWGTYVTEVEAIGRRYAEGAADGRSMGGNSYSALRHLSSELANTRIMYEAYKDYNSYVKAVEDRIEQLKNKYYGTSNEIIQYRVQQDIDNLESKKTPEFHQVVLDRHRREIERLEQEIEKISNTLPSRYLYDVEIPDEAEADYLDHVARMEDQPDILERVDNALTAEGWHRQEVDSLIIFTEGESKIVLTGSQTGGDLYEELAVGLGSPQEASEFLDVTAGVVGIKYPSNYLGGGNNIGAKNYVIFNENDAKIVGKEKYFLTEDGSQAYGFTKDGKIFVDPAIATSETPIHEYGHLWCGWLKKANPKAWTQLCNEILKQNDVLDYVKRIYPDLEGDDLAEEVFNHYSGRRGADRLRQEEEAEIAKANGIFDKARIKVVFDKIRRALRRFWEMSRDLFAGKVEGIEKLSAEDFADMMMVDLMAGFNGSGEVAALENAPTFYSNAERAVENVKQNKATGEQWKAMLTKAGGIKAGEDKWMGLSTWLDDHKSDSLTKDEVLQFVKDNGIQMEETHYGELQLSSLQREFDDIYDDIVNRVSDGDTISFPKQEAWEELNSRHDGGDDFDMAFALDSNMKILVYDQERAGYFLGTNPINLTRLYYTSDDLENKREIAFVIPDIEPYQEDDEIHFGPENEGKAVMWVRFGEAQDTEGNHVLVIDEIQSNRHQDAMKVGYTNPELIKQLEDLSLAYKRAERNWMSYARQLGQMYAAGEISPLGPTPAQIKYIETFASEEEVSRLHELGEASIDAGGKLAWFKQQNYGKLGGVPAAPFEKNWHEVAMKRMLRLAAEEGFDKVAWTTGMQQAERYDIGKVVTGIDAFPFKAGVEPGINYDGIQILIYTYNETLDLDVDENGKIIKGQEYEGKNLSDVVGKEIAAKLLTGKEEKLRGDDFRIGGEGMKGFYDQMLPRFMDKYGKRWGVKTGKVTLDTPGKEVMHSVDVTPAMRKSVMEVGQPLFSVKARQERTLMGVHNITEEKLRNALKLGGLANPSMAVIDTSVSGFDNFGEISLIPDADLIASREGRNAGTWGADAYSPRFPETHRRLGKGGDKKRHQWIQSLKKQGMREEMVFNTGEQFNDYYNSFNIRDNALVYPFLFEKGLADEVDFYIHKDVDTRLEDDLREANGDQFVLLKRFDEDDEYKQKITDIIIGDEVRNISRKDGETFQEFRDRRREWAKEIRESLTEENGYVSRYLAEDLLFTQARAYRENGKFSESRTHANAEDYIRQHGMEEEYQQYFEQKMQELGAELQMYAGSDREGRSKFKAIDLESVSKQMKKQGRAGGEGGIFDDSPGAVRAKLLNPMKTLDQIRKEKGRIVGHEEFEQARQDYQDELRDYADRYTRGSSGALADILTSGNMAATARQYNIALDADAVADLNEFKARIRQLPTEYFETKFERPVMLEEFRKAVVPDDLPLDLWQALADSGLELVEYKAGDKEDRKRVMLEATKEAPGIRFHFVGEKGATQADKSDNGNRMENKAIAEQMEQAGKDARNIKLATGWERGKDGKWRYEIMDFDDVDVIGNMKWMEEHPDAKRARELLHKINANLFGMGEPLTQEEQKEYTDILKKYHGELRFDRPIKNPDRLTLEDYVKADELFAAYPELRDMPVKFEEFADETRGTYRPQRKEIAISAKYKFSKDGLRNELLHEVQHAIQHIEGFASGSSEQLVKIAWENIKGVNKDVNRLADSLGYQDWIKTLTPDKLTSADDLKQKGRWFNLMYVFAKDHFTDPDLRDKFIQKLDKANDVIAENKQVTGEGLTTYQAYRGAAGEVEARNVQGRAKMSREERRGSLAESTEDIPRDKQTVWRGPDNEAVLFDIRKEPAPKKTGIGYKVFVLKDGKLYPPMVANPGGEATPFGVWLNADAAPVSSVSKTGRQKVKAGGKGTQGGSGQLAYRPGWHLGEIPYALQFNRKDPETGEKELFPANFVWAEVEYADDVDYQDEAMSYGVNANGNFQHSLAGLPRVPENGSYRYRTNPNPETDPWIITGAMKVNRILKPSEVDEMVKAAGREPQRRQEGAVTDEQIEALNQQLRDNIAQYNDNLGESVASETGSVYHTKDGKRIVYKSLFEDMMPEDSLFGNQQEETKPERQLTEAERIKAMSDEELLKNVSEGDVDTGERNFYSDEYDRRHNQEYFQECDRYRQMLEDSATTEDQAEEMLINIIRDWRDKFNTPERTTLLAQFDTLNDYYFEKSEERMKREEEEEWEREQQEEIEEERRKEESYKEAMEVLARATKSRDNRMAKGVEEPAAAAVESTEAPKEVFGKPRGRRTQYDPTEIRLRKLEEGEQSYVERRYVENNMFDFTGSDTIESAADVAYIFRQLETSAVENCFLVLIKDGKPTILHIGMGGYNMTIANIGSGILAASALNPDTVIMLHNHPSGTLNPSAQDIKLHQKVVRMFGEDKVQPSIIIDITSGKYVTFTDDDVIPELRPTSVENEVRYQVYNFNQLVFDEDWNPDTAFQVKSSTDVAAFVSSHRLGEHDKVSLIVLDNSKHVVGNVFLPWTSLNDKLATKVANEVAKYTHQMGGNGCILYGSGMDLDEKNLKKIMSQLSASDTQLVDCISVENGRNKSYNDYGMLLEESVEYSYAHDDSVDDDNNGVIDNYTAGRYYLDEALTRMMKAAADNKASVEERVTAMRAIGGNLSKLRQAMSLQREYDRGTVNRVVQLAKDMMDSGLFKDFSRTEVKRLVGLINNAAGNEDISWQLEKVFDMLQDHELKEWENLLQKMMRVKASKLNSSGVQVQGQLDVEGQRMMETLKEGMSLDADRLSQRIAECEGRMDDADEVVAGNAKIEFQGLMLAQQYHEEIKDLMGDSKDVAEEICVETERIYDIESVPVIDKNGNPVLKKNGEPRTEKRKHLKAQFKRPMTAENEALRKSVEETIAALQNAQRGIKGDMVKSYERFTAALGSSMGESARRAKEWRDQQVNHVNEIHHNANSDLEGIPVQTQRKAKTRSVTDNGIFRLLMKPLATYEKMFRYLGSKSPYGEGYLFNRFVRGRIDASDEEWRNKHQAEQTLDAKANELFGVKRWSDLYKVSTDKHHPGIAVTYWDNGEFVDDEITQGEAMYFYMVNKMEDGKMKLRRMGVSEENVNAISQQIDPRLIELADWLQDDFLPSLRRRYSEVYERMYGSPMPVVEHYAPLVINESDLKTDLDINDWARGKKVPSTVTGSVIKRSRNTKPIKVHTDALDLMLDHIDKMEHWAAFAELNRDLNTLRNYGRFRNRLMNMSSLEFGSGENKRKSLLKTFEDAVAIGAEVYTPKVGREDFDTIAANVAKGVTASKINMRIYTALKQLLSAPAFISDANPANLAKSLLDPGTVKWAWENLPGFSKRWGSRMAGDVRLMDTESDWKVWRRNTVRKLIRIGMTPNAAVDCFTVAVGARAVYNTAKQRYLRMGFPEELADRRALQDASISYNSSQQSSDNAFLSAQQLDRTLASVAATVFRSASMGYQRRLATAMRNLKKHLGKDVSGKKAKAIEHTMKLLQREGLNEEQARQGAERLYRREYWHSIVDIVNFGFVLPFFWNLGPTVVYLLMGDDDDKKEEMLKDAARHSMFGPIEGLTGGAWMSETGNAILAMMQGEDVNWREHDIELLPILSDIQQIIGSIGNDNYRTANDVFNLLVQSGLGVNPQTLTDAAVAILDYCDGDPETSIDTAMLVLRILQTPQSQLDQLYIDELGIDGKQAQGLGAEELVRRYARYKTNKELPAGIMLYNDEAREEAEKKRINRFNKKVKERLKGNDIPILESAYDKGDDYAKKLIFQVMKKRMPDLEDGALADLYDNSTNEGTRKAANNELWHRIGFEDPIKNNTEYNKVYNGIKKSDDLEEDIELAKAQKDAELSGNKAREKAIAGAREKLTNMRSRLGHGNDEEIMERLRMTRRKMIERFK